MGLLIPRREILRATLCAPAVLLGRKASAFPFPPANASFSSGVRVQDVFSTTLYTGNGASRTITNGVDLSGKGGLLIIKDRSYSDNIYVFDSARGPTHYMATNLSSSDSVSSTLVSAFTSSGFSIGTSVNTNLSSGLFGAWSFCKNVGFHDVVTYTGTGANQTINHGLKSTPGLILIKRTDASNAWVVYHGTLGATKKFGIDSSVSTTSSTYWNDTAPTTTQFTVGTSILVNANGGSFIAYLFASNPGAIRCGSFNTDSSGNATVSLGWEPQLLLTKADALFGWELIDQTRGWASGVNTKLVNLDVVSAESTVARGAPSSTGFTYANTSTPSTTVYYMAIRKATA